MHLLRSAAASRSALAKRGTLARAAERGLRRRGLRGLRSAGGGRALLLRGGLHQAGGKGIGGKSSGSQVDARVELHASQAEPGII